MNAACLPLDDGAADTAGARIVMSSERGGCGGECLVRVPADLSAIEPVLAGGAEVDVEGISAVGTSGTKGGGPHEIDLYLTERAGDAWGAPVLLTGDSTYAYNNMPALGRSGARVDFDCGSNPYPGPDGVLFESSWPVDADASEFIGLLPATGGDPTPLGRAFPDGKHALTLVDRAGGLISVLTPDVDVADIGLGCSG